MDYILLVVGFVCLTFAADWLVDGASGLAKRFNISDLAIGMTVVAFGTSMPEFVVNMVSVADGATDLAITNILGSNIINTFVILGLTALVYPIASKKRSRTVDIPLSAFAGLAVFGLVMWTISWEKEPGISRVGGGFLLLFFAMFLWQTFRNAKVSPDETETFQPMPLIKALGLIVVGLTGLVVGGELIVKSAVKIATAMGISESIIGLTIVALGTSLPELATSVMAAYKRNSDIALGNVIGSNIFNVFFILGTSSAVMPLPSYKGVELDALMAMSGSVLVWLLLKTSRQQRLTRVSGALMLISYTAYLTYRLSVWSF